MIALINLLIFKKINFSDESVILFGGLDKALINDGQVWRLVTASFGHMSLVHVIVNMPIVIILSRSLERYFGSWKFFLFLILTSISAGIGFYYFYEGTIAIAGSSGPAFGFIGILTFLAIRYAGKMSASDNQFTVFVLIAGILVTFTVPGVAMSAHAGGFVGGFVVAFINSFFKQEKLA